MLSVESPSGWSADRGTSGADTPALRSRSAHWLVPLILFGTVAAVVWLVVWYAASDLPRSWQYQRIPRAGVPGPFEGFARWDATWYRQIAADGYSYTPGAQSSVAFFPAYPLAIRALSSFVPDAFIAGSLLTLASGFLAAALLWRWCLLRFERPVAIAAVAILALYPYSIYLYGPVYADALFLACSLGAFLCLEHDRLWWAGLLGFVATAARPAGIAVALGLLACLLERRAAEGGGGLRAGLRGLRRSDARLLLAFGGLGSFCLYLWWHFGDPLLFARVEAAPGWDQPSGPATWGKVAFFEQIVREPTGPAALGLLLQVAFLLVVLAFVPRVVRRVGWGYAVYVLVIAAFPLVGSKDFQGTGRYLLPAFPVVAVAAEAILARRWVRTVALPIGLAGLIAFAQWFARGNYLA